MCVCVCLGRASDISPTAFTNGQTGDSSKVFPLAGVEGFILSDTPANVCGLNRMGGIEMPFLRSE